MNTTQRTIIVIGSSESQLRKALEVLEGFKAITPLKNLTEEKVKNVFAHNKNALHLTEQYDLGYYKYNPVVVILTDEKSNFKIHSISVENLQEDFPKFMDSMGIDVGDHIKHDSSTTTSNEADCLLCKIRDGKSTREEFILYDTDNFYVIPGLGAFFEGYLMIVPKDHVMSFAELSNDKFDEFKRILGDLRLILEGIYHKKVFAFECGSGKNGAGKHKTSITHAHFHLAPTDMPVFDSVCKSGLNPSQIKLDTLFQYGEFPYMLYGTQDDEWYICSDPDSYFPRQHPRQILADYMGLPKGAYNWRIYNHEEKLKIIATEFTDFIKSNYEKLPIWTQMATKHLL